VQDDQADEFVHWIATDWRLAGLAAQDQVLCAFAEKLTSEPTAMIEDDVLQLRESGWSDRGIHDATQVIAYFNYINRIADALNVDLERGVHAWEESPPKRGTMDV
jgi:uncharacterized peroxidase-related enzyme